MNLLREKIANRMSVIEFAIVLLLSAYYIMPAVNSSIGSITIVMLGLAYLAFVFLVDPPIRGSMVKMLLAIVVLAFFYTVLTDTDSISATASNYELKQFFSRFYQYFMMYFPVILLTRVDQLVNKQQRWILLLATLVMIAYVVITTMSILAEDANATRGWQNFDEYEGENLGNYYFVYAVPIIIACLSACVVRSPFWVKVLCIAMILFFFVFLINAQYTLAILISIIGVAYQVTKSIKPVVGKAMFLLALLVFCLFIPNMLEFAIERIRSAQITTRLREILAFLTGEGADGYNLNGRLTLYWETIKAFFASPLWGNQYLGFDGHATFLTVLANTGILGGIPFYWLFFSSRKHVLTLAEDSKELLKPAILMFALMGLTNPIQAAQPLAFATWFIAPLMIMTIFKKENVQDEKAVEN